MTNDQDKLNEAPSQSTEGQDEKKTAPTVLHNPLDPNDPRKFTLEDADKEQQFKEALTERD